MSNQKYEKVGDVEKTLHTQRNAHFQMFLQGKQFSPDDAKEVYENNKLLNVYHKTFSDPNTLISHRAVEDTFDIDDFGKQDFGGTDPQSISKGLKKFTLGNQIKQSLSSQNEAIQHKPMMKGQGFQTKLNQEAGISGKQPKVELKHDFKPQVDTQRAKLIRRKRQQGMQR